jgi:endonuclease/exonuclease/phosphatase family metal-dependent hydrolase
MPIAKQLRSVQLNAENLFLFFDEPLKKPASEYSEKEWQRLSSSTVPNKPLRKALALGQALLEIDADLVMVNEVGGMESLSHFNTHFLRGLYEPLLIEGNSDRGIDCGYLIRKTLPLKPALSSYKDRPLNYLYPHERTGRESSRKSQYFSRDCLVLRLFDPTTNQLHCIFMLVHLKSKLDPNGIDPEGRERRAAELKVVLEIYNEVLRETDGKIPICLAGDFNGISHSSKHEPEFAQVYEKSDLQDVFDILGRSDEERATQVQITRSGRVDLLQIDAIFVSPLLRNRIRAEETYVYRYKNELNVAAALPKSMEERQHLPSDHYPVVATFTEIY